MMRYRALIGRINRKQGLMINSFYVLRESLTNFKKYADGLCSNIEKGEESEGKGHFKLPEIYGGSLGGAPPSAPGGAKPGGKPAAAAKPPPSKQGKPGAKEEEKTEDQSAAEENARR